jgi:hypothetical protein
MEQTALEWLYDQIENKGKCIYEVFEQAKAMEKEQIINALHYFGIENAEQYYNKTFK